MNERTTQPNRRNRRGASMVEFVIVMGLLFFLLFGIMEFGFMMSSSLTVNSAAHQGARAAALQKDVNAAVNNGMAGLSGTKTTTVEYADSAGTWSTDVPSPLTSNHQVRVTVAYDYTVLTFVGSALPGTTAGKRTLTGRAVMRYGG